MQNEELLPKHLLKQGGERRDDQRDPWRGRFCARNNAVNGEKNINRMWRLSRGQMQIQSKMHLKVVESVL